MSNSARQQLWTLQCVTPPEDFTGGQESIEDIERVWLTVEPASGRDSKQEEHIEPLTTHNVTCHYRPTIKPGLRFVRENRVLNIQSAIGESHQRDMRITAIESELIEVEQ